MAARTPSSGRVARSAPSAASGRGTQSNRAPCIPPPPAAPSSVTVTVVDDTHLTVGWTRNDVAPSVATGYTLQRATDSGFTANVATLSAGAGATSYADSGRSGSTTYYYRVRADGEGGSSSYSVSGNAKTAPAAPSSLSAVSAGSDAINLTWSDNSSDETSFRLTRATDSGFTANVVTQTLSAGSTSYQDTGLNASTAYYYKLQAVRSSDYSGYSSSANATTDAQGTLSLPSLYSPLSHIKSVQAAFSSTPVDSYMDSLLGGTPVAGYSHSTSVIEGSTQANGSPVTPSAYALSVDSSVSVSLYTNITNIYGSGVSGGNFIKAILEEWLEYADAHSYNREAAFFHAAASHSFSGGSASGRPSRWFWGIVRVSSGGSTLNNYTQTSSTANAVTWGAAVGDYVALGNLDRWRSALITVTTALAGGYTYALEYPTAVDGSGVPTAWATLTPASDGTSGLTTTGTIDFDPPSDWVPATIAGSSRCFYWVRFRCTHTGTTPVASSVRSRDYLSCVDNAGAGTVPAYDYASDTGSKGWLTAAEYAGRASGKDAYFASESREPFRTYGAQRLTTNPTSQFRAFVNSYYPALFTAAPSLQMLFLDNNALAGNNLQVGATVVESTTNFGTDWENCLSSLWAALRAGGGTRWVWPHSGQITATSGDPCVRACRSQWNESRIKALKDDWTVVDSLISDVARLMALTPTPQFLGYDCNFLPLYGAGEDRTDRAFLAALAYFYQAHVAGVTGVSMVGGDAGFSWQDTWRDCIAFNVGSPTGAATTTTGNDPAKPAAAPAATPSASGGTIADGTYYFKVSYGRTGSGACESLPNAAEGSFTVSGGGGAGSVSIASPPSDGLTPGWFVYVGNASGGPYYRQGTDRTIGVAASLTSLTFSGTQPISTGQTYKVYKRIYDNAIAYYRPISHTISVAQGTLCDSSAVTVTLPQSMQPLNADGTKGSAVSSFQLRAGEGAIYCF